MKRNFLVLLILIAVLFISVCLRADITGTGVYTATAIFPTFIEAEFLIPTEADAVSNVSSIDQVLNIQAKVNFGGYINAKSAELIYYFEDASSNKTEVHYSTYTDTIHSGRPFYISNLSSDKEKFDGTTYKNVYYQIKITFDKTGLDSSSLGFVYFPAQATEYYNTFFKATISSSASKDITAADGGTVEYDIGNKQYGNAKVTIPAGALSKDARIIINQLELENPAPASSVMVRSVAASRVSVVNENKMVGNWSVLADPSDTEIYSPITMDLSYSETQATKFEVRYRESESDPWGSTVKIKSVNTSARRVQVEVSKFGYYGIFISSNLDDNDYRPAKRVRVKSRISDSYNFRFNNLSEGDVVKIYNINGRKVAEITTGDSEGFIWKGKKGTNNSGDWAESGTYVYQIKLKDKGKIISGTIAFVW